MKPPPTTSFQFTKKTTVSDKHPPSFFEKRGRHTHNTNLRGSSGIVNASILPQSDTGTSRLTLTPCTCRTAPTLDRCCRGEHPDARHPVSAELGELRTQSPCTVTVFAPPSATTASNHYAEALCPRPTNQDEYTDEKILLCLDGAATIPSAYPTESNWRCTGRNGPLSSRRFSATPWRRVPERSWAQVSGTLILRWQHLGPSIDGDMSPSNGPSRSPSLAIHRNHHYVGESIGNQFQLYS